MKIIVSSIKDTDLVFEGTGWHVDDLGRLHIIRTGGNAATVNTGHWMSVREESRG